jgi:hypothetical protein
MRNKALISFLITILILIFTFQVSYYIPLDLPARLSDSLRTIALMTSFVLSIFAAITGVKEIKNKENSFIYNLIAIVGSTLIIIAIIGLGILLILLNLKGLPKQD